MLFTLNGPGNMSKVLPEGIKAVSLDDQDYVLTPICGASDSETQYSPVIQVDGPTDIHGYTPMQSAPTKEINNWAGNKINHKHEAKHTEENSTSQIKVAVEYVCKNCGVDLSKSLVRKWHRCTDPQCRDVNICNSCCDSGYHSCHTRHLMPFTMPVLETKHCDSCGSIFSHKSSYVYVCTLCPNYAMCYNCYYWAGMHCAHADNISKISVKEILAT